jgi:hypothetical protein
MHRPVPKFVLMALAAATGAAIALQAQAATPTAGAATAASPASSSAAARHPVGKRLRQHKPRPVVAPGVTGGTPEASARDPGGPPPGTPSGLTIPIPSIRK